MDDLFLLLFFTSLICLIVGLIKPTAFSRFIKGEITGKKIGLIFGIAAIVFIVLFGIIADASDKKSTSQAPSTTQTETNQLNPGEQAEKAEEDTKKLDQVSKYEFINTKTETTDGNKIDLYVYSGNLNLDTLKTLCKENKQKFTSGKFYYLVVFDSKENAVFPKDPFTAEYGMEETPQKHIRAIYTYNRINGYSKLDYYDTNRWEGTSKTEEL